MSNITPEEGKKCCRKCENTGYGSDPYEHGVYAWHCYNRSCPCHKEEKPKGRELELQRQCTIRNINIPYSELHYICNSIRTEAIEATKEEVRRGIEELPVFYADVGLSTTNQVIQKGAVLLLLLSTNPKEEK